MNMTSEEAQKELLDAFILYVLSAKKSGKLPMLTSLILMENRLVGTKCLMLSATVLLLIVSIL